MKRSIGPRCPSRARPAVTRSGVLKPRPRRCWVSVSQSRGAKPTPKCSAAAWSKPRSARNCRPTCGGRRGQLLGVELGRHPVGLDQLLPLPLLSCRPGAALLVAELHAEPVGEALDRLGEGQVVDLHDEGDDVAADLAAEAVEGAHARADREGRRLLVVEGAEALEVAAAGRPERDHLADHVGDVGPLLDEHDVLVPDPACHGTGVYVRAERSGGGAVGSADDLHELVARRPLGVRRAPAASRRPPGPAGSTAARVAGRAVIVT